VTGLNIGVMEAIEVKKRTKAATKGRVTFARYDAADYLKTEADMLAYLRACAEEGDPALIAAALGAIARARGMQKLAKETGISRQGLYKALSKDGEPSFSTIAKVAKALGLSIAFGN
jgi:probable addiction module antidote protein